MSGMEKLKRKLESNERHIEILNEQWKISLDSVRLKKGKVDFQRVTNDTGNWIGILLHPIATNREWNELSNIWSRKVKWMVNFKRLNGESIVRKEIGPH